MISPFSSISGSAIRFWNIAIQLQKLGHRVIYVERRPKDALDPDLEGIVYHTTPVYSNLFIDILVSTIANTLILLKNLDCRVVYALKPAPNNCMPALLARILGKKIILDIDDLDYAYLPSGLKRTVYRRLFDFFPRFFPVITYHTKKLCDYIVGDLGIPPERTTYLRQGVSPEFLETPLIPAELRIPQSVVYMATLGITSDFEDLLPGFERFCRHLPQASIHVIGDGVRRPFFEQRVEELGIARQFHFLGRISHAQMPACLGRFQTGVNYMRPSLTNDCRAVLKVREYLAAGLQIVCNAVGDVDEFAPFVSIAPDIDTFFDHLSALILNPVVNSAGRRYVIAEYSWRNIIMGLQRHI